MEATEIKAKLKLRVQTGLSNPNEFIDSDELFDYAIDETLGIIGNKDLADAFVMDIAYYRFLLLADGVATEQNESDYKQALSMLKKASNRVTDTTGSTTTAVPVMVKQRANSYR